MSSLDRIITLRQPATFVLGIGCAEQLPELFEKQFGPRRIFAMASRSTRKYVPQIGSALTIWDHLRGEPTIDDFQSALTAARDFRAELVLGIGGGSVLDVAKLVAAMLTSKQPLDECFGIDKLTTKSIPVVCLPTTAGTGSEVSPNSILLDSRDQLKKGIVSPHLISDLTLVDPKLSVGVPPEVTGATGLDALTHCIEAYVNKLAHPIIDLYALEGIRLINGSLQRAVDHGDDLQARADVMLGSVYGGLCLGPVNTGAVHALSYPLGGEFHIAHGAANALLLPHVIEFNLPAATERYAKVAVALGCASDGNSETVARRGVARLRELVRNCRIKQRLGELNIPRDAIPRLAKGALTVQRLLVRNVREVTLEDAISIYEKAM